MGNTVPHQKHNTENSKDEQHGPPSKTQHRKPKRWATRSPIKNTTQKTQKMGNTVLHQKPM
jgi:hypothetical protein